MEIVKQIDQQLFLFFNQWPHTPGLDALALAVSGIGNAGFIWFVLALWLFLREERRGAGFFVPFFVSGVLAAAASEIILKPFIGRVRPVTHLLEGIVVGNTPETFSFPSTHATLAWALAAVIAKEDRRMGNVAYILAVLVSLSRIYLGVHYPVDVIAGAFLGLGTGKLCVSAFQTHAKRTKARAKKMR